MGESSFGLIENLKLLFIKLCNPVKLKLIDFLYKVSPDFFTRGIGNSSLLSTGFSPDDYQLCGNLVI